MADIRHIYISTGEVSGEQHAAALVRECRKQCPNTAFTAMGTDILRNAGVEIAVDASQIQVMGLVAVVKHLPAVWRAYRQTLRHVKETRPDMVVLVDYPGYHLRLAKTLKKRFPEIPIVYYIVPQVWAWHQSRVNTIRKYIDYCLCILPFEPDFYRAHGVPAEYVGSPVADAVRDVSRTRVKEILGLDDSTRLISVFPGSRRKEIQYLLPPMVEAARILHEQFDDLAFVLAAAPGYRQSDLERHCTIPGWMPVLTGHSREIMAGSYFCIAKSGTTTLEAALLDCPLLMAYAGDWLSALLARSYIKLFNCLKMYSLPNIIAGRAIIPEFLQEYCNGPEMARVARLMLKDEETYETMLRDLREVKEKVGDRNAAETAARALFRIIAEKSPNRV